LLPRRILREITLLRQMDHENIVNIINILPPIDGEWTDLYIVSELMETDLHRIIYSKQALSTDHCQYFVYQILRALKYMHSANVMHRDLKPSNLLLNSNCDLKVCDLGLARGVEPEQRPGDLTEYVVTRWYRAPEIMLACTEYAKAIDVWSTGCIFAELLERQAVFPGDDYIDQIRKIIAKLGKPGAADLDFVTSEKARRFILDLPETPGADPDRVTAAFRSAFPGCPDDAALDLLRLMLVFNPRKRASVEESLAHPFMASLHMESDEPCADFSAVLDFEKQTLDRDSLRQLAWGEMLHYNPQLRPPPPPQPAAEQAAAAADARRRAAAAAAAANPAAPAAPGAAGPRGVPAAQLLAHPGGFHMVPAPPMAMLPGGAPMGAGQLTAAQQQQLMAAQLQAQQQAAAAAQAQAAAAGGGAPAAAPGAAAPQLLVTTVNGQQVVIVPTPAGLLPLQGVTPAQVAAMTPQQQLQLQQQIMIQQFQMQQLAAHQQQLAAQQQSAAAAAAAAGTPLPPGAFPPPGQAPPAAAAAAPGRAPPRGPPTFPPQQPPGQPSQ